MAQFTPTSSPRGRGPYDDEEDMPYLKREADTSPGSEAYRPKSTKMSSSRDGKPSSRHRSHTDNLSKAEREAASSDTQASKAENQENAALGAGADNDNLYNAGDGKKRGIRGWSRRKKAAVGGAGVFGAGIIGVLLMGVGPFQFMQLAQNLTDFHFGNNEQMMDGRVSRIVNYARGNAYRSNLGVFSNQVADVYERKLRAAGFEPDYNDPNGNPRRSIQAYVIDTNSSAGRSALGRLQTNGVTIPAPDANGRVRINLRGQGSSALSRRVINAALTSIGINRVSSWMGNRLLNIRTGGQLYHPLTNRVRERGESFGDYTRRLQEEDQAKITNGSVDVPEEARSATENPEDPEGNIGQANDEIGAIVDSDPEATASRLSAAVRGGASVLGVFTLVCALDKFGEDIGDIQYTNLVLPLIRTGVTAISTGFQAMANEGFNANELGVASQRLFDPETGLGWSAALSIQAEYLRNGAPSGPDLPESSKPRVDKPAFFATIDNTLGGVPGSGVACGFLTSSAGGWFTFGIEGILSVASGSVYQIIKTGLGEVAGNLASPFIQDMAVWLSGKPLDEFAQGALYGNQANYGARLAANDAAISTGAVEMSDGDVAVLDAQRQEDYKIKLQNKNLYARLFDPYERGSLVARTVLQNPHLSTPQAAGNHFAQLPTTVVGQIGSSFSNLFTPRLKAIGVGSDYDYGFPEFGYIQALQEDPRFEDPYENARIVNEHGIDRLNDEYGECFNMSVTPDGNLETTDVKRMDEIDPKCKDNNNEILVRYRFYIADTVAMKSLTCLNEIDDAACGELGFASADTSDGGGGLPDGDAAELAQAILDNPNIGKDNPEQFQSIVDTGMPCPSVSAEYTVDVELLRIIAALGQNNTFTVASLHRGCTGSTVGAGTASRHWRGKAADISGSRGINGVVLPSFEAYDPTVQKFIDEAAGYLPAGCELGVPNSRYVQGVLATSPACTNVFLDTPGNTGATGPHVHIGVP